MTILLIDLGNTALKWTVLSEPDNPHTIVHRGMSHFKNELFATWLDLKPTRVIGCTVAAPNIAFALTKFFNEHGISWEWVSAQPEFVGQNFVITNHYENYRALGSDRWYAAIGAASLGIESSLLVSHMGTATTVDSIVYEGESRYRFEGGRIAPGPSLMKMSLARDIPHLNTELVGYNAFPKNTGEAIMTGIIDSQVGLLFRARERMIHEGQYPYTILAGGAAKWIAPYVQEVIPDVNLRHNLVLHGLAAKARVE